MRVAKYVALVIILLLSVALPLSNAYADSGSQVGGVPWTSSDHDGQSGQGVARPQQFTPLTGVLRPVEPGKKRYAIVVGSDYSSVPDNTVIAPFVPPFSPHLNWAADDALAMAGLLKGLDFHNVIALVGSGRKGATRANVLDAIQTVKSRAKEGDEVVFYFSGHGAEELQPNGGQGNDVASAGIVTDEGTSVGYIWDGQLASAFRDFQTDRIVFIFDECLSGGMTEVAGPGRLVLMATTKDGICAEDAAKPNDVGIDHGFFTYFLMAALTGKASQADALVDGILKTTIVNPYEPAGAAAVSVEQAFDYASYELLAVSPLVQGGLTEYYGPQIAAYWGTPLIIDEFKGDLLL